MRALFAAAAMLAAGPAWAQPVGRDFPEVPSPLTVASDPNGVNLTTGQMAIDLPVLATPAAPNLRFDRLQNAAPHVEGKGNNLVADYSVHTGGGASEAFHCNLDGAGCESRTLSGSTFNPLAFVQAGSVARYAFTNVHVDTLGAPNGGKIVKYVSNVRYPNGEVISYDYDSAPGSGLIKTWFRPRQISSSMGYRITLSYEGGNLAAGDFGSLRQAALYRTGASPVLIRRLVYSGSAITDHGDNPLDGGGREFACTGCNRAMGSPIETASGSLRLPGEGADTLQLLASTQPGASQGRGLVGSVVRDGVAWNYSYANLSLHASTGAYWYDSVAVTGPNGFNQLYTMVISDRRPVLTGVRDSLGRTVSYEYDTGYRPKKVTQPEGNSVAVAYGENGGVTSRTATSRTGETVTERIGYAVACPIEATARCYRPDWSTDGLGRRTDYAYNERGQLIEQTDPADQRGYRRKTYIAYEESSGHSRRKTVRTCLLGSTCGTNLEIRAEYEYWGATLLPSRERRIEGYYGRIRDTHFAYDDAGRPLSTDGPLPGNDDSVYSRFDRFGRKSWEIGARSREGLRIATRFTYRDSDDKLLYSETGTLADAGSEVLNVFSRSDFAYDPHRNPIRVAVSAGGAVRRVTDQSWDDRGRLVCTAVRMNRHSFGEAPGACAHSTPGTQGPDRIARNHYDAENRLIRVEKALGTPILQDYAKYEYGPNGTRSAVIDANGNRAEMAYDGFDRLRRWTFPSNAPGNANPADYEEYGYDLAGNRTSLRKRDGSLLTYVYDNHNRVIRKVVPERPGLDPVHTRDVFYAYDHALGLQTHARFDSLDGEGVATWYDGFGQPTTVLLNMGGVGRYVSYYHDDAGNLRSLGHPDGAAFVSDHDALGRVTATFEHRSPASMDDYLIRYWYNPAGNRSGLVRGAGAGGFTTVWYRDPLERPTTLANDLPGTANDAPIELAYNEAGQIVSRTVHNPAYASPPASNAARGYTVNGLNQYTGTTWGGAPNWSFEYDPNGNLTRSIDPMGTGTTGFLYDVENRLVAASGATSATLNYDPLGRLFQVTGGNGAVTRFLYDGDKLIAEYDGSGTLRKRYVHGPGADEPVAVYEGAALGLANRRYTMPDERGSIAALVNADGTPWWINRYDSWGVPGDNRGRFQYTGQAWIPELGLYYYKARFYSPWLGRFMQTDPIGYNDQINLYGYVQNDPVSKIDPSGASGVLTIFANNDHAWIGYRKDGRNSPVTWGRFARGHGNGTSGVQINTERDRKYAPLESRSMRIDDAGEERLFGYLRSEIRDKGWELWDNCVDFATGGWAAGTGEDLGEAWGPQTPRWLLSTIWQTNRERPSTGGLVSLPSVASEKGYESVVLDQKNNRVTGTFTPTGARFQRTVVCDGDGKCRIQ